jgi:hypothetical protein
VSILFYVSKHILDNSEVELRAKRSNTIIAMSANVRYYTPLCICKKSCYCRALLIIDDINGLMLDIICFHKATYLYYNYLTDAMPGYGC